MHGLEVDTCESTTQVARDVDRCEEGPRSGEEKVLFGAHTRWLPSSKKGYRRLQRGIHDTKGGNGLINSHMRRELCFGKD